MLIVRCAYSENVFSVCFDLLKSALLKSARSLFVFVMGPKVRILQQPRGVVQTFRRFPNFVLTIST